MQVLRRCATAHPPAAVPPAGVVAVPASPGETWPQPRAPAFGTRMSRVAASAMREADARRAAGDRVAAEQFRKIARAAVHFARNYRDD